MLQDCQQSKEMSFVPSVDLEALTVCLTRGFKAAFVAGTGKTGKWMRPGSACAASSGEASCLLG